MSEKLQQAIASIRSGNKQLGQQLLAQVIQEEPSNENAWLWMSAVVDESKRQYCIERVLKINPNNQQALMAMGKMKEVDGIIRTSSMEIPQLNSTPAIIPVKSSDNLSRAGTEGKVSNESINLMPQFEDLPKSLTSIALTDGLKMGFVGGLVGIVPMIIAVVLRNLFLIRISLIFASIICMTIGLATGIVFFRRKLGSSLAIGLGGGLSGVIAGAICGLIIGYLTNGIVWWSPPIFDSETFLTYLTVCGCNLPLWTGGMGVFTVWIPRLFIKQDYAVSRKHREKIMTIERALAKKQTQPASPIIDPKKLNDETIVGQKFWVNPTKSKAFAFILHDHELISAVINPDSVTQFQAGITKGSVQHELLQDKEVIAYHGVNAATKIGASIKIEYIKNGEITIHNLECADEHTAKLILDALFEKLSPKFEKNSSLPSIRSTVIIPGIAILTSLSCLAVFYFTISQITINQVYSISGDYGDITVDLLQFLASGGMAFISGGIVLIALGTMIYRVARPLETIKLTIKENISEKLDKAIASIKGGDLHHGQQLLTQVLNKEPNNEKAWFWMSTIAPEDKKHLYFEQILRINPDNQQALQALVKLKQMESKSKAMPSGANPLAASRPLHVSSTENSLQAQNVELIPTPESALPQFWVNSTRKGSHIIVLHENKLLTAKCESRFTTQVTAKLAQGGIPTEVLTEKVTVSYSSLIKVEETSTSLRFDFSNQSNRKESIWMECKDKKMLNAILRALETRLGTDFERNTAPMSRVSILMGNGVLMTIILAVSAFFYFGALDIDAGGTSPTGSARTRGIIILLDWIGPGGVACIGGGLFLLVLISMVMSLAKPTLVTTLLRKNANAIAKEPEKPDYQMAEPIKKSESSSAKTVQSSSEQNEMDAPPSLLGAALSDGLMAGLAGGVLGAIMPIIFMLTNDSSFFVFALLCNGAAMLAVGIFTGILFYQRKLPRGTKAVGVGGGLGGAIAGGIGGLLIGYSMSSSFSEAGTDITQGNALFSFLLLFCCAPAIVSSIFGAITAAIPGLFIKPDPNVKPFDWKDGKTEVEIARIENLQASNKRHFQTRLIFGGIAIVIILIATLCQSLLN